MSKPAAEAKVELLDEHRRAKAAPRAHAALSTIQEAIEFGVPDVRQVGMEDQQQMTLRHGCAPRW